MVAFLRLNLSMVAIPMLHTSGSPSFFLYYSLWIQRKKVYLACCHQPFWVFPGKIHLLVFFLVVFYKHGPLFLFLCHPIGCQWPLSTLIWWVLLVTEQRFGVIICFVSIMFIGQSQFFAGKCQLLNIPCTSCSH